jgi:SAM-dependent methyltransferase
MRCNICGSLSFGKGPNGRLSKLGKPPRCEKCQSLERHRAFRAIAEKLQTVFNFSNMSALQFSKDLAFRPDWFKSHLLSVYGGVNSTDLQNINYLDNTFDIVICNHVLEHIADDRLGLKELIRVVKNKGVIFLSFPNPLNQLKTRDWGFPDEKQHGHYRIYGADAIDKFQDILDKVYLFRGIGADEATGSLEEVWLMTKNIETYQKIVESGVRQLVPKELEKLKQSTDGSLILTQNNKGTLDWLLNFISAQPTDKATCQTFLTAFNSYSFLEANKVKQLLESNSQLRQYIQYCLQHCDSQTREITKKINLFTPSYSSLSVVSTPDGQMEQLPLIYPIEHSDVFEPRRSYKEFDTELEAAYSKKAHYFRDDIINDNKLVSIIMPTYNRANCIMKAINSVIQQSYSNWELLIIDDGSTDNTLETIETLSDNRIKIHKSQHQGVSAARNKGLENAKGDIIFYLDSDNEWTQYFLEYMLIALMSSKVKCAYSGLVILDDDNNILGYRGDAFNWTKCLEANYVDMNVFCHHRHLYQELGGFDESLKRMVDWDVILRYTKKYPPVYAPFIGCKYLNSKIDLFRISTTQPRGYKNIVQAKHT